MKCRVVTPPTSEEIPALKNAVLDMKTLSELPDDQFASALGPIVSAYGAWIEGTKARLVAAPPDLAPFDVPARQALDNCRTTLQRIRAGLELLVKDSQAAEAFRFANRAMWLQRIHSIHTREVRQDKSADLAAIDIPINRTWYPFQLAFILLNLPSLTDPLHPDRSHPTRCDRRPALVPHRRRQDRSLPGPGRLHDGDCAACRARSAAARARPAWRC